MPDSSVFVATVLIYKELFLVFKQDRAHPSSFLALISARFGRETIQTLHFDPIYLPDRENAPCGIESVHEA